MVSNYDTVEIGSLGHQLETINAIIQAVIMNNRSATSKAREILLAAGKTAMLILKINIFSS